MILPYLNVYIQSTLRFPLVVSYIKMILPYLNIHTILINNKTPNNIIPSHKHSNILYHILYVIYI